MASDEVLMEEMGHLCSDDLFDHIDDLLNFPASDDIIDVPAPSAAVANVDDGDSFPPIAAAIADDSGRYQKQQNNAVPLELDPLLNNEDNDAKLAPCEDVDFAELDWLSNFLDDSSESFAALDVPAIPSSAPAPVIAKNFNSSINEDVTKEATLFRTPSPVSVLEQSSSHGGSAGGGSSTSTSPTSSSSCSSSSSSFSSAAGFGKPFPPPLVGPPSEPLIIPGRARTKRPRPTSFVPRLVAQPVVIPNLTPAVEPAAVPLTAAMNHSNPESFGEHDPAPEDYLLQQQKKKKKKAAKNLGETAASFGGEGDVLENSNGAVAAAGVRKCTHCEITKTPQWRAGPMGPKTLCNACGVRYKSGRLFPEYRPAASPTFMPSVHSNSHKKVVEMRIKASQKANAWGMPVPDNPAIKGCDLLQFIRTRDY